jgi:hypothetical protein
MLELIYQFLFYAYFVINIFFAGAIFEDNYGDPRIDHRKLYVGILFLFVLGLPYILINNAYHLYSNWRIRRKVRKAIINKSI